MATDQQVKKLMKELDAGETLERACARAGMIISRAVGVPFWVRGMLPVLEAITATIPNWDAVC